MLYLYVFKVLVMWLIRVCVLKFFNRLMWLVIMMNIICVLFVLLVMFVSLCMLVRVFVLVWIWLCVVVGFLAKW